ncbi:MAG: hypothetical protein ACI9R3_004829, partial [Verrucomicrobiales bacterium]
PSTDPVMGVRQSGQSSIESSDIPVTGLALEYGKKVSQL